MNLPRFIIYLLHHESSNSIYIGKSTCGLIRPLQHGRQFNLNKYPHYPVVRWINKLRRQGFDYKIAVIEEHDSATLLAEAERDQIAYWRSMGFRLLNCTEGGDGTVGWKHTEEARKKMSVAASSPEKIARLVRMIRSPETRAKLSATKKGVKFSDEARAKMSVAKRQPSHIAALVARNKSPKQRAAVAARNKTPEHRAAVKAGQAKRPRKIKPLKYVCSLKINLLKKEKVVVRSKEENIAALVAFNRSEEGRRKQAISHKGKKASPETRAKMSATRKGKKHSLESRAKMSEAKKGKSRPPIKEETRVKMSVAMQGRSREIIDRIAAKNTGKIRDKTKKFIEIWQSAESCSEVAQQTGLSAYACSVKASQLRGRGHVLKQFSRWGGLRKQKSK